MADLSMLGGAEDDHAELKKLNAEVVRLSTFCFAYGLLYFFPFSHTQGGEIC